MQSDHPAKWANRCNHRVHRMARTLVRQVNRMHGCKLRTFSVAEYVSREESSNDGDSSGDGDSNSEGR